jgi:hypothetical protein
MGQLPRFRTTTLICYFVCNLLVVPTTKKPMFVVSALFILMVPSSHGVSFGVLKLRNTLHALSCLVVSVAMYLRKLLGPRVDPG